MLQLYWDLYQKDLGSDAMEYFRLMQDQRYSGSVFFDLLSMFLPRDNLICNYHHLPLLTTRQIKSNEFSFYPDVMDQQMYLVSQPMHDLLSAFMPNINYRIICFLEYERKVFNYYYAYLFEPLDCFSTKSEANKDRSRISKLMLRKNAVGDHDIFKLSGVNCHVVVVSLPVAEAILRRNLIGYKLETVELE